MFSHGPSTKRERETLLLLREALPEYEINPHMRLANVVKGRLSYIRAMGQYELDFVVQNKSTGDIVCAIELDDPTHDTNDGRRRDGNKNRWMAQAKIKLIRIRTPQEALGIRELINQPADFSSFDEFLPKVKKTSSLQRYVLSIVAAFAIVYAANQVLQNFIVRQQQQIIKAAQKITPPTPTVPIKPAVTEPKLAPVPHYERRLVKGKSARECSVGNVITNETISCMKDHYEMVLVGS